MAERVWEDGESECPTVMAGIGIQNLSRRESVQTSIWCNSRQRLHRQSRFIFNRPEGMQFFLSGESCVLGGHHYDEVQQ